MPSDIASLQLDKCYWPLYYWNMFNSTTPLLLSQLSSRLKLGSKRRRPTRAVALGEGEKKKKESSHPPLAKVLELEQFSVLEILDRDQIRVEEHSTLDTFISCIAHIMLIVYSPCTYFSTLCAHGGTHLYLSSQ